MMKPYRQQHLYRLWQDYLATEPMPQADRWLAFQFKSNKQFGKKDRQFYADAFFTGLRHALFAAFCMDCHAKKLCFDDDLATWLDKYREPKSLWQRIKHSDLKLFFSMVLLRSKHPDMSVCDEEILNTFQQASKFLQSNDALLAQLIWYSLPVQFLPHIEKRKEYWSLDEFLHFLNAQDAKPPLWLRIKSPEYLDRVKAELTANNMSILQHVPLQKAVAIAVAGDKGIYELECYQQGLIEIQDLASQMIGDAVQWQSAKPMILDACAGGGGKTMQIAAGLNNIGAIYAMDIRAYKLDEIKRRAKKGGFHNIRTHSFDWTKEALPELPKEIINARGFDCVLVDAPCSSSGTWRRNPDAKWRYDLSELMPLNQIQYKILQQCSKLVKPHGYLVYATCSFLTAENENIVEQFLQQNPEYKLQKMHLLGAPLQDSDSMFVAVWQKVS